MSLVTSRGYNLQSGGLGQMDLGAMMDKRNARQQRDIQQGLAGEQREWLSGGGLAGDNALEESARFGLDFQKKIANSLGMMDKRSGQIDAQGMDKISRFAQYQSQKSTGGDPDNLVTQNQEIIDFARTLTNPAQVESVLDMIDDSPEERKEMFETMAMVNLPPKDFGKFLMDQRKAEAAASAPISAADKRKFEIQDRQLAQTDRGLDIEQSLAQSKIAKGSAGGQPQLPPSFTKNLSPELAQKLNDVWSATGGGDKGMKAVEKALETGSEQERRAMSPTTLKNRFPQADEQEMRQLQAVVDSSKNTENGFKSAAKLRGKQRQKKDFGAFKQKAVGLLQRIIDNPETDDITGSREGQETAEGWSYWTDNEANAVADIQEAKDILTGDNLKLMSGVLSESDIRLLANLAGGALNRLRSDDVFIKDVEELRDKLMATNANIEMGEPAGKQAAQSGLTPEKKARLEQLKAMRAAGKI